VLLQPSSSAKGHVRWVEAREAGSAVPSAPEARGRDQPNPAPGHVRIHALQQATFYPITSLARSRMEVSTSMPSVFCGPEVEDHFNSGGLLHVAASPSGNRQLISPAYMPVK
jgi:hypothetical protein